MLALRVVRVDVRRQLSKSIRNARMTCRTGWGGCSWLILRLIETRLPILLRASRWHKGAVACQGAAARLETLRCRMGRIL
jgi:hypothetical protein